ncbi:retention module-containing protein, partial [Neptuniibacter marinus]|uniref:retention module-containing protein n=1 Tax=Neptuniibacter marinus TaxID=1806670 RepID=UPI000A6F3BAC
MSVIGTVSHLIGRAVAIKSDGTERTLALGDQVYADEMVRVAPDASIEIAMDNGDLVKLDGGQNWLASSETYLESDNFDTSEAAADAESIQAAILAGADPTDVAEETAAGGEQGGAEGNEGSSTVNIQRTAEEVDPNAGYETTGFGQGDTDRPLYEGDEIALVQPVISISGPSTVVEGEIATYTITISQPVLIDMTISVITGHVTTDDGDLVPLNMDVTIPAGQSSVSFDVQTNDDYFADSGEQYQVSVDSFVGGGYENIELDTSSVTTTVLDQVGSDNPPGDEDTVLLDIDGPATVVEGEVATYTVSVTNPPLTDLVVSVVTGHITTDNGDLVPVNTNVTIAAGTTSTTFDVLTTDDSYADTGEQFTVSITGSTGGGYENLVVGGGSVTTTIEDQVGSDNPPGDEDTATISLTGPSSVVEGNTTTPYTISVDQPAASVSTPITVTFTYSGVAVDGTDFTGVGTIDIPVGSNSNTFTIDTLDDVLAEGAESFTIAIDSITDTNFEHIAVDATNNSVETQITDDTDPGTTEPDTETAYISLTGPASVIEGNTTTPYTVAVDQPAADVATPITVTFTYSGVAADGTDFTGVASVDIPAGSNSNTFTIDTLDDV